MSRRLLQFCSAVTAIMVTQTRKFLTMLLSFALFPKPVSVSYFASALWVLAAIALNVLVKTRVTSGYAAAAAAAAAAEPGRRDGSMTV
jgi:hypothetical protein